MVDRNHSRSLFSTGQLAETLGVSPDSIIRWLRAGILRGHRLPATGRGGTCSRIPLREACRFAVAHGLVTETLVRHAADAGLTIPWIPAALVITSDPIRPAEFNGMDVTVAENRIQTGFLLAQRSFDMLLIDCAIGRSEAQSLGRFLRDVRQHIVLGVVVSEDDRPSDWHPTFSSVWQRPVSFPACVRELWQSSRKVARAGAL